MAALIPPCKRKGEGTQNQRLPPSSPPALFLSFLIVLLGVAWSVVRSEKNPVHPIPGHQRVHPPLPLRVVVHPEEVLPWFYLMGFSTKSLSVSLSHSERILIKWFLSGVSISVVVNRSEAEIDSPAGYPQGKA